jgi:MFS family permease
MAAPATGPRRALTMICLASAGWAFSFGLIAALASLWLAKEGWNQTVVGLNISCYYLGIALAALVVPRLMRRLGPGCVAAGCVLSGVTVVLFPWGGSLAGYFGLRLLNGAGAALSLIPLETYVNRDLPADHRARNFGFYACALAFGIALGTWVGLAGYASAPHLIFLFGGAVTVLTAILGLRGLPRFPEPPPEPQARGKVDFVRTFPGFGTGWLQGFMEGAMFAHLNIYLFKVGLSAGGVGWITSGIIVSVLAFQLPVTWLADRLGRTWVLLGCYAVVLVSLALAPMSDEAGWLAFWLFLAGAFSAAFYPLGLALLGERVPATGLARANAWFLAINCLGSLIGPSVTGAAMDHLGTRALFAAGVTTVLVVLAIWAGLHLVSSWQGRKILVPASTGAEIEQQAAA